MFCLSRFEVNQFKICLKQKRRVCLTEMKNENLLKTESDMKQEYFELNVKQTCWSNERTNFAGKRKLNWFVLIEYAGHDLTSGANYHITAVLQ